MPDYIESEWCSFIEDMENHNFQFEWGETNSGITLDAQDIFIPKAEKMEEYLTLARNMYFFICYEDSSYYLDIIYDKIKHNNLHITNEQYERLLQLFCSYR